MHDTSAIRRLERFAMRVVTDQVLEIHAGRKALRLTFRKTVELLRSYGFRFMYKDKTSYYYFNGKLLGIDIEYEDNGKFKTISLKEKPDVEGTRDG